MRRLMGIPLLKEQSTMYHDDMEEPEEEIVDLDCNPIAQSAL